MKNQTHRHLPPGLRTPHPVLSVRVCPRPLIAGAQATDRLQGKPAVFCGIAGFDVQHLFQLLHVVLAAAHIAGGSQAEFDGVLSTRSIGKK